MFAAQSTLALIGNIGMWELLVIGLLGLLIFGRRLPEVGRNMGKFIIEFKRGLQDVKDDVEKPSLPPGNKPAAPAPSDSAVNAKQADA